MRVATRTAPLQFSLPRAEYECEMSRLAAFGLLALGLALALPASAGAARNLELALQDDAVFVDERWMERERALDHAEKLGAARLRVNVLWARTIVHGADAHRPPAGGIAYDFSRIDALQQAAAARGIRLQLTLTGPAPAFATADRRVGPNAPDPGRFAAFARAVAAHFKGRVDRYSIWNEPNWGTWLAPRHKAAAIYRRLYLAGHKAVKTVDPRAQVLIGELAPYGGGRSIAPLKFLRDLTCSKRDYTAAGKRCAPLRADGFAIHPYQFGRAPHLPHGRADDTPIGSLSRLTRALDALARRRALSTPAKRPLDLYLTEFGYLTEGTRAQKPKVRAAWLAAAYEIARRHPRVRQILQYQLVDPPASELWHSAILHRDGRPHAAYRGLARAASKR